MQTAKEKMSNMGTTVKEGMDKAKASAQEKVEKVSAHNPADKEIACEKKDAKQTEAELRANAARAEHQAEKQEAKHSGHTHTGHHSAGNIGHQTEKKEAKQAGHTHTGHHSAGINIGGGTRYTNAGTPGTYDSAPTGRTGRDYL